MLSSVIFEKADWINYINYLKNKMWTERVIFMVSCCFGPGWAEVGSFASLRTAGVKERQRRGSGVSRPPTQNDDIFSGDWVLTKRVILLFLLRLKEVNIKMLHLKLDYFFGDVSHERKSSGIK